MALLGDDLTVPKLVAIALAVYAVCYGTLLLIATGAITGAAATFSSAAFIFFGLIALAATPFFAIVHLNRITDTGDSPPARPIVMTIVMAVPTTFWLYVFATSITPLQYIQFVDFTMVVSFILVPGILSLWLAVTFALLAIQGQSKDADIE